MGLDQREQYIHAFGGISGTICPFLPELLKGSSLNHTNHKLPSNVSHNVGSKSILKSPGDHYSRPPSIATRQT